MKVLYNFGIALLALMLMCCGRAIDTNQTGSVLFVDVDSSKPVITNDEAGLLVPDDGDLLSVSCSFVIGEVEDMKFDKDRIFVLGDDRQKIHVLNSKGVCENEISRLGKSSKEYIEITDFYAANGSVYVLDQSSQKVVEYGYDGTFKGSTNIERYWANYIFVIDDHLFLVNQGSETEDGKKGLFEITKDGTLVASYLPFEKRPGLDCDICCAPCSADTMFYADRESNTIYKVTKGKCEPYITLDFGKYNLPEKYKGLDARELMFKSDGDYKKYSLGIEKIQVSGNLLFVRFDLDLNSYLLVIDYVKKEQVLLCRGISVKSMYQMGLMYYYMNGDYVYNVYDAEEFVQIVEYMKDSETTIDKLYWQQLNKAATERQSDIGNPVIVKYKINNK